MKDTEDLKDTKDADRGFVLVVLGVLEVLSDVTMPAASSGAR